LISLEFYNQIISVKITRLDTVAKPEHLIYNLRKLSWNTLVC